MKKISFAILLAGLCILNACSKDDAPGVTPPTGGGNGIDCGPVLKTFAADVNPIIQSKCTGSTCHASGSNNGPGDLLTFAKISGAKVAIKAAVASGSMPKNGSLTPAQKNSIICWVDAGAQNN